MQYLQLQGKTEYPSIDMLKRLVLPSGEICDVADLFPVSDTDLEGEEYVLDAPSDLDPEEDEEDVAVL